MTQEEPILRLNPSTGYYEGYLKVQVDAGTFQQRLITDIEKNEQRADLTNPATWAVAIARIGKIKCWLDWPHVNVTPVEGVQPSAEIVPVEPAPSKVVKVKNDKQRAAPGTAKPLYEEIETDLRVRACSIPPYRWLEELVTPIPAGIAKSPEKQRIYYIRSDQRKVLAQLLVEWEAGTYYLDPEAAVQQKEYQAQQDTRVHRQIEAVAEVVNGNRLH